MTTFTPGKAAMWPTLTVWGTLMTASLKMTLLALVAAFTLAACDNTIRGVGRDVGETADAVEDSVPPPQ